MKGKFTISTRKTVRITTNPSPEEQITPPDFFDSDLTDFKKPKPIKCPIPQRTEDQELLLYVGGKPAELDSSIFEQLEKWKKDSLLQQPSSSNQINIEPSSNKVTLQQLEASPEINMQIIDMITRDSVIDKGRKINKKSTQSEQSQDESDSLKQKKVESLQNYDLSKSKVQSLFKESFTQDLKQKNENKKIINNILFNRVTKIYDGSKSERTGIEDANQQAEQIFLNEVKRFSQYTLSNFKQLLHVFQQAGNIVDYDGIRQKLLMYVRQAKKGVLNENPNEQYMALKKGKEQMFQFKQMEKTLLDNFESLNKEITLLQSQIKEYRCFSHDLATQLAEILMESTQFEESAELDLVQRRQEARFQMSLKQSKMANFEEELRIQDEKLKQSILLEQKQNREYYERESTQLDQDIKHQKQEIETYEKRVKQLKSKKEVLRSLLKQLYLQCIKDEENIQGQSLVWIAKSLLEIEVDLMSCEIFPPFLDKQSIQFLLETAKIENNLDKLQTQLKSCNQEQVQKQEEYYQEYLNSQKLNRVSEVKKKISRIAVQDNSKIMKPVFFAFNGKQPEFTWESLDHKEHQQSDIIFSLSNAPTENINQLKKNQSVRSEISSLQEKQKQLKNKEVKRLINLYISFKDDSKQKELKQTFVALLGEEESEEGMKVYRQKLTDFIHTKNNKSTFSFQKSFYGNKFLPEQPDGSFYFKKESSTRLNSSHSQSINSSIKNSRPSLQIPFQTVQKVKDAKMRLETSEDAIPMHSKSTMTPFSTINHIPQSNIFNSKRQLSVQADTHLFSEHIPKQKQQEMSKQQTPPFLTQRLTSLYELRQELNDSPQKMQKTEIKRSFNMLMTQNKA